MTCVVLNRRAGVQERESAESGCGPGGGSASCLRGGRQPLGRAVLLDSPDRRGPDGTPPGQLDGRPHTQRGDLLPGDGGPVRHSHLQSAQRPGAAGQAVPHTHPACRSDPLHPVT